MNYKIRGKIEKIMRQKTLVLRKGKLKMKQKKNNLS